MRSNIPRTSAGSSLPVSCVSLTPPRDQRVLDAELVEAARDDEVDEVVDRVGAVVEAGRGEEDHGARLVQRREPAQVDRRERRLARDEDELPPLLERDRGRAVDQVLHRAGRERADGRHRARADHVRVHLGGAARVRALEVALAVDRDRLAGVADEPRRAPPRAEATRRGRALSRAPRSPSARRTRRPRIPPRRAREGAARRTERRKRR